MIFGIPTIVPISIICINHQVIIGVFIAITANSIEILRLLANSSWLYSPKGYLIYQTPYVESISFDKFYMYIKFKTKCSK